MRHGSFLYFFVRFSASVFGQGEESIFSPRVLRLWRVGASPHHSEVSSAMAFSSCFYHLSLRRSTRIDHVVDGEFFPADGHQWRSEEHTSELQSQFHLVC